MMERKNINFALGSSGEFHSCIVSFKQAGQISDEEYEQLDKIHYKVENELIKLIKSLQKNKKIKTGKIPLNLNDHYVPTISIYMLL